MRSDFQTHYGLHRVRSTLKHFLLGKSFTVVCSVTVLILLARGLSVEEFATLVLLQAIVNLIGTLSSFGAAQTSVRYLPELRADNNNKPMYRMMFAGTVIRGLVTALFLVSVYLAYPYLAKWINLGNWLWLMPWYLIVGWLRLMSFFLQRLAESLFWQKAAQYSLAVAAILKLAIVLWLVWTNQLGLFEVVLAELFAEGIGALVVLLALVRGWMRDAERRRGDNSWLSQHRSRVFSYGLWSYAQVLASALYGTATNRLVVSRYLSIQDLGLFGFVSAMSDLARRYLPTRLLQGIIRPLFFAKYAVNQDSKDLSSMGDFNFRLSLILLAFPTIFLFVAGPPFLDWLTADKYGSGAYLLVAIFGILALESFRSQISLLAQSVERNQILLVGNIILSASLLIAIPLISFFGIWSIIVANTIGNVASIAWIMFALDARGVSVTTRWALMFLVAANAIGSAAIGFVINEWSTSVTIGTIAALAAFSLANVLYPPLTKSERGMIWKLLRGSRNSTNTSINDRDR